ncbi:MAG: hypothetical protein AAF415_13180 [Pseudomonadota bacterium]
MRAVIGVALAALAALPARAVEDYDACIALAASAPEQAVAEAEAWSRFDGGWAARHCYALALAATGATRRAAVEMAGIATEAVDLPRDVRAEMFITAGEWFLDLNELGETAQTIDRAERLAPQGHKHLILSAELNAELGDLRSAIAELNRLLKARGPETEPLLLRATIKRRLGDGIGARDDAYWASELDPELPEVWLEVGQVEAMLGNRDNARAAWLRAIEKAPEDPLAETARRQLQLLESGQ